MTVNLRGAMIAAFSLAALAGCVPRQAPAGDIAASGGSTAVAAPSDKFRVAVPARWHEALLLNTGQMKMQAYVPEGESREHWTEMLSVIVYDRSVYTDLSDVAQGLNATYQRICTIPAIVAQPDMISDNGYSASVQIARCGKGAEGNAHIVVQKAIDGRDGFYVVKRAWTLPPVADSHNVAVPVVQMQEITAELDEVHFCDTAQHTSACANEARPAAR